MAILTPIALPLAYTVGGEELIPLAIGSVFSGSIFGDHVSPISDTTIMSSIFAGSDHIAHVKTQLPYALVTAAISGAMYLSYTIVGNAFILLGIGIVVQLIVLRLLGNWYHRKHRELQEN